MTETRRIRPVRTRRRFTNAGDEIGYLYDKLLYWLYGRHDRSRALVFAERMERLLPTVDAAGSIRESECRALIAEAKLDWPAAVRYRRREIRRIERLRDLAPTERPAARRAILRDFGPDALADRYDLLALALWNSGRPKDALEALARSEQICRVYKIPFDGVDIRNELLQEIADPEGTP